MARPMASALVSEARAGKAVEAAAEAGAEGTGEVTAGGTEGAVAGPGPRLIPEANDDGGSANERRRSSA